MTFDCKAKLKPMKEWVKEKDPNPNVCKPCSLGVITQWYRDELKEQGQQEIADDLEKTVTDASGDADQVALTICEELDTIKESVEQPLRERLKDFDCAIQAFNPDDATEEENAATDKNT
jgi:predicted nucleotide-binding protein